MNKSILLSFDIEEFDIPEEYGQHLEDEIKFEISSRGLSNIIALLNRLDITATFLSQLTLHSTIEIQSQNSQNTTKSPPTAFTTLNFAWKIYKNPNKL